MSNPIDHTEFLTGEVEYWRRIARTLSGKLTQVQNILGDAARAMVGDFPPEPPVGTRYFANTDRGAVLAWERREPGWYCTVGDGCEPCPVTWDAEVAGFVARNEYTRCLPGEMAPPLAGRVAVEHPEVPW